MMTSNIPFFLLLLTISLTITQAQSTHRLYYKQWDPSMHGICTKGDQNNRQLRVQASFQQHDTLWLLVTHDRVNFQPPKNNYHLIRLWRVEQGLNDPQAITVDLIEDVTATYKDGAVFKKMATYPDTFHLNYFKGNQQMLGVVTGDKQSHQTINDRPLFWKEYEVDFKELTLENKGRGIDLDAANQDKDWFGFKSLSDLFPRDTVKCPTELGKFLFKCVFRALYEQSAADLRAGFYQTIAVLPHNGINQLAVVYNTEINGTQPWTNYRSFVVNSGNLQTNRWGFAWYNDSFNGQAKERISQNVTSACRLNSYNHTELPQQPDSDTKLFKVFEFYENGTYDLLTFKVYNTHTVGNNITFIRLDETTRLNTEYEYHVYDLLGCGIPNDNKTSTYARTGRKYCPYVCHPCSAVEHRIGCSGKRLERIPPKFDNNIIELDVSWNEIFLLGEYQIRRSRLHQLENLNASHNRIYNIIPTAFDGATSLKILDLSHNEFSNRTLDNLPSIFKPLAGSLVELHLNSCGISVIQANTFFNFAQLEILNLDSNKISNTFPRYEISSHLPKIKKIFLRKNPLICDCNLKEAFELFSRRNNMYWPPPQCSDEDLGIIQHIHGNWYDPSRMISDIFICRINPIVTFWYPRQCGEQEEWIRVQFTVRCNLNQPVPEKWDRRTLQIDFRGTYKIVNVTGDVTDKINETALSLRVLNISHNNIREIPANAFAPFRSLQILWLNNNQIFIVHTNAFFNLTSLRHLHLENNRLQALATSFPNPQHMPALSELHIQGNAFLCDCRMKALWNFLRRHVIPGKMPGCTHMQTNVNHTWENFRDRDWEVWLQNCETNTQPPAQQARLVDERPVVNIPVEDVPVANMPHDEVPAVERPRSEQMGPVAQSVGERPLLFRKSNDYLMKKLSLVAYFVVTGAFIAWFGFLLFSENHKYRFMDD